MAEILHVVSIDSGRHMGPGQSVPSLCRAEVALGRSAAVLNAQERTVWTPRSGEADQLWRPIGEHEFRRLLEGSQIVHFNGIFHLRYLALGAICRRRSIPYVICPRGSLVRAALESRSRVKKWLTMKVALGRWLRGARAIHFLTEAEAALSVGFGVPVVVVPNGVNIVNGTGLDLAQRERAHRIVFVGRMAIHHKGLDRVLDFASRWRQRLEVGGWSIHLYGPDYRGGRSWLAREIRVRDLEPLVSLHGPVSGAKKAAVLESSRLFVHPSRFEGQPQAVLEALMHGCPVAVTEGTNVQDEVLAAGCGYSWETMTSEYGYGVLDALSSLAEVRQRGRLGRDLVERDYTWEKVAVKTLEQLDRIAVNA
jgi:glycosyltransferase involved in cell wall biosynthesis